MLGEKSYKSNGRSENQRYCVKTYKMRGLFKEIDTPVYTQFFTRQRGEGSLPIFIGRRGNQGSGFPVFIGKRKHSGSGLPIFVGRRHQYGSGFSYQGFGFWSNIGQSVKNFFKPLLSSDVAAYAGKKGLKAALGIAKDTLVNKESFKDSLKKRASKIGKEIVHDIKEKVMGGTGSRGINSRVFRGRVSKTMKGGRRRKRRKARRGGALKFNFKMLRRKGKGIKGGARRRKRVSRKKRKRRTALHEDIFGSY
jgi:hypothetical protein